MSGQFLLGRRECTGKTKNKNMLALDHNLQIYIKSVEPVNNVTTWWYIVYVKIYVMFSVRHCQILVETKKKQN